MSRSPEEVSETQANRPEPAEYSPEERAILLELAHQSIVGSFSGQEPVISLVPPHLSEPRGVFTTLYLNGELRGCVGYVQPIAPLYRAVTMTARAAAFEDTRFSPVSQAEAGHLVEVGALAAEKVAHVGAAVRLAVAEGVRVLAGHGVVVL